MDHKEAQERMQEIQRIMERATLWTLLPGTPAVIGGLLVLVGCVVSYVMFRSFDFADIITMSFRAQIWFCVMWFAIGAAGVIIETVMTASVAVRKGLAPTVRSGRLAAYSMTPSVVVAMVLTVKFLIPAMPQPEEIRYIVPVWMMLYGTGVYTAGLFSIRAPRILGILFLVTGIVPLFVLSEYGVLWAAVSFGLYHIIFGIYIIRKQREYVPNE